ncbi:MAG: hypothetical protein QQN63_11455 [Nitrosopumilus sp.]
MSKYKGQKEVEQMIYKGHRLGVCDSDGNSVDSGGIPVARPKNIGRLRLHKIYPMDGPSITVVDSR